jgi:prepilin-type N-terminal cleavage/methylation domain-containing protein
VKKHKGFTLVELIVVIMIISLIASLVFSTVVKQSKKPEKLEPLTLSMTLRKAFSEAVDIEFFCIQKSTDCYVIKGGEINPYARNVDFGNNLKVHLLDENNQLVEVEEFGRLKDQKITFRYTLYANRSTTQMILSNDKGVYYLPSYFGDAVEVEDMSDAKALWIKEEYNLRDQGNYY